MAPISEPLIIGLDFMCHFGAMLDFQKGIFKIQDTRISLKEFITEDGQEYTFFVFHLFIVHSTTHNTGNTILQVNIAQTLQGRLHQTITHVSSAN